MLIVVSYFLRFEFRLTSPNNHRVINITCLTFLSSIFFIFFSGDVRASLIKLFVLLYLYYNIFSYVCQVLFLFILPIHSSRNSYSIEVLDIWDEREMDRDR